MASRSRARVVLAWTVGAVVGLALVEWILIRHVRPEPSLMEKVLYGLLVVATPIAAEVIARRRGRKPQ